jgi:simple sugar transport system permease protein
VIAPSLREALLRLTIAVAAAVTALNVLVWAAGVAPAEALRVAFEGSLASPYGVGQILFRATPILLAALAARVALLAGLFNIGVEGQMAGATLAVGAIGAQLGSRGFGGLPLVAILVVVSFAAGACVAGVPALLRARFGASEVIAGIVTNQLVAQLVGLALRVRFALPGTTRTASLPDSARFEPLARAVPALTGSPVSTATVAVFVLAPVAYLLLRRARLAREWALLAETPGAMEFSGVPVRARRALALVLSGAVAGLVAVPMVLGYKGYAEPGLGAGAGFAGLAAAMMGGPSAAVTVVAALWFGTVDQAGLALHALVPKDIVFVMQATSLAVAALLGARRAPEVRT